MFIAWVKHPSAQFEENHAGYFKQYRRLARPRQNYLP
jgi:hypothetical protein